MKLVCFAVKEEAPAFRKLAGPKSGVATLVTGMGRHNAESAVRRFLASQPAELVLTSGFAGGLHPDLAPGAVVYETTDEDLAARLNQAGAKPAKIFCADRVAVTVAEKQALRKTTGADAVEMESAAIQNVCRELKIPCATVRVISDAAGEDLPTGQVARYWPAGLDHCESPLENSWPDAPAKALPVRRGKTRDCADPDYLIVAVAAVSAAGAFSFACSPKLISAAPSMMRATPPQRRPSTFSFSINCAASVVITKLREVSGHTKLTSCWASKYWSRMKKMVSNSNPSSTDPVVNQSPTMIKVFFQRGVVAARAP